MASKEKEGKQEGGRKPYHLLCRSAKDVVSPAQNLLAVDIPRIIKCTAAPTPYSFKP